MLSLRHTYRGTLLNWLVILIGLFGSIHLNALTSENILHRCLRSYSHLLFRLKNLAGERQSIRGMESHIKSLFEIHPSLQSSLTRLSFTDDVTGIPAKEKEFLKGIVGLFKNPRQMAEELAALDSEVRFLSKFKRISIDDALIETLRKGAEEHGLGVVEIWDVNPLPRDEFLARLSNPGGGNLLLNDPHFKGRRAAGNAGPSRHGARTHAIQQYISMKAIDARWGKGSYAKWMQFMTRPGSLDSRGIFLEGVSPSDTISLWGALYDDTSISTPHSPEGFYTLLHELETKGLISFQIP